MSASVHSFNEQPSQRKAQPPPKSDPLDGLEWLIWLEKPTQPIMTKWGHIFWYGWLDNWLKRTVGSIVCPTWKDKINRNELMPVFGNIKPEQDNRYQEPAEELTTMGWIWKGICAIFLSGFGVLTVFKLLNLGQYFGDRNRRRNPNEPYFEGNRERNIKIALVFVLMMLILLKLEF